MLKQIALLTAALISFVVASFISAPAYARDSVSVTITMSVYLPPEVFALTDTISLASAKPACADLLASSANAQQTGCQDGNMQYSWTRNSSDLLLTVAPI